MRPGLTRIPALFFLLLQDTLTATSSGEPSSATSISSNSTSTTSKPSISAVCTPLGCAQGSNSLNAGTTIITPLSNGTSRRTVLLPGTYTSMTSTLANTSLLSFDSTSTFTTSPGFMSSGTLGESFTVSLLPGLTTFTSPLFQSSGSYLPLANVSLVESTNRSTVQSFLISDNVWVILSVGTSPGSRVVAWKGVGDVGNLVGGTGGVVVRAMESSACPIPCASGGVCGSSATCVCKAGFTGSTCNACSPNFFGPTCSACASGCNSCDSGITGSGGCLLISTNVTAASACNCLNGVCATAVSTSICSCNAGWTTVGIGIKCGSCETGYYLTSSGDCLACDPTCSACSGPTGTCLTCQLSLQPLGTDATKCITSNSALANGTFVACPPRTFYSTTSSSCVTCNPLCDTCWNSASNGCLSCRTPNALLGGQCVGYSTSSGVCDSVGFIIGGSVAADNAVWVLDNAKGQCDALPAKCTAGGISSFTTTSTRSELTCSVCLSGTFLFGGKCITSCPAGTISVDGKSCIACDSGCSSCRGSPSFCTVCSIPSKLSFNGTCIVGPTCPSGFFSPPSNTTCLACHPDCATCVTSFDKCTSCPSTRPILSPSTSTCVQTCSIDQYFDITKSSCIICSASCETCGGNGDSSCMSCSSTTVLKQGSCVAAKSCSTVVPYFGICLSSLVGAGGASNSNSALPWWTILLIVVGSITLFTLVGLIFRRTQQKRRRMKTAQFAYDLGQKEVDLKLHPLPSRIVYPTLATSNQNEEEDLEEDIRGIPLTPPFISRMAEERDKVHSRWSGSSFASTVLPWGTHNPYSR